MKTRIRCLLVVVGLCLGVTGCKAREPETVGLSGIVYNYSQDALIAVYVGGRNIGSTDSVQPGAVTSGGTICCFRIPENAKEIDVEVKLTKGRSYKTTATIEKWWPDLAHYGVVHILPGRKVVVEIRSVHTWPRKDLMESQLRALGIKRIYDYTGPMNDAPMERTDGVKYQ